MKKFYLFRIFYLFFGVHRSSRLKSLKANDPIQTDYDPTTDHKKYIGAISTSNSV